MSKASRFDNKWSSDEVAILIEHHKKPASEISKLLTGRSISAIKGKRSSLGLGAKAIGDYRSDWSAEEIDTLKNNRNLTATQLSRMIDKTQSAIHTKLSKLHLHREYYCDICGDRLSQQGSYCNAHTNMGKRIRYYSSRMTTKNFQSNLTRKQITALIQEPCHYCGISTESGGGIDRLDNTLGYTVENAVPCCEMCNEMKLDSKLDDWILQMKKIISHMESKA